MTRSRSRGSSTSVRGVEMRTIISSFFGRWRLRKAPCSSTVDSKSTGKCATIERSGDSRDSVRSVSAGASAIFARARLLATLRMVGGTVIAQSSASATGRTMTARLRGMPRTLGARSSP